MVNNKHPYHLVTPSPWPLVTSIAAFAMAVGGTLYMHKVDNGGYTLLIGFFSLLLFMGLWWRDVVRESTFEGHHTKQVQQGLRYGMILFIASEVMFFFAFFWAFFHSSISPAIQIGGIWPPLGIETFNPWEVPLLNTAILVTSGITITWCHKAIVAADRENALYSLAITIGLGLIFTVIQAYEYITAPFSISDSVYGSVFYMATGFHGFHVIVGTLFLIVCLVRLYKYHFTRTHHFGFEAAAWYWHFVDVVWLFLFVTIYWWGGSTSDIVLDENAILEFVLTEIFSEDTPK